MKNITERISFLQPFNPQYIVQACYRNVSVDGILNHFIKK